MSADSCDNPWSALGARRLVPLSVVGRMDLLTKLAGGFLGCQQSTALLGLPGFLFLAGTMICKARTGRIRRPTMTFSFKPRRPSFLPMIAASVSTRVVSWNDAAEMKESVDSDALVIPSSTLS